MYCTGICTRQRRMARVAIELISVQNYLIYKSTLSIIKIVYKRMRATRKTEIDTMMKNYHHNIKILSTAHINVNSFYLKGIFRI